MGYAIRFDLPVVGPDGAERHALGTDKIKRVAWLQGDLLVAAPYAQGLRAWDMGAEGRPVPMPAAGQVLDLEPAADASLAAAIDQDGAVWWIDPGAAAPAHRLGQVPGAISVAVAGETVWVASRERVTSVQAGGARRQTFALSGGAVLDIAVDTRGARLASGHLDGTVRLWSLPDGALLATLRGHTARAAAVAFHPRRASLLTGSWDGTVRVWDLGPLDADPETARAAVSADWGVSLAEALDAARR